MTHYMKKHQIKSGYTGRINNFSVSVWNKNYSPFWGGDSILLKYTSIVNLDARNYVHIRFYSRA